MLAILFDHILINDHESKVNFDRTMNSFNQVNLEMTLKFGRSGLGALKFGHIHDSSANNVFNNKDGFYSNSAYKSSLV